MSYKQAALPDPKRLKLKKTLSAPALLSRVRNVFNDVKDWRKTTPEYSLSDVLMSGLAVFSLKFPSLLDFDNRCREPQTQHNLNTLYGIKKAPSDTQLRAVLDPVNPHDLRPATVTIIQELQRQNMLKKYRYMGKYLISADGTGHFSSTKVHCKDCCEKHHRKGDVEYYHQLLVAAMVHPNRKAVLPMLNEAITKQDGVTKNDCEANASKRLIPALKHHFPRMDIIILADALAANAPYINRLRDNGMNFILNVKPGSHDHLFAHVQNSGMTLIEITDKNGMERSYGFINDVALNSSNPDVRVNFVDYAERDSKGKEKHFTWITDIVLSEENIAEIVIAGRCRWKIENETFNTLKTLGYHLDHNYGHGKQHLSSVLANLMLLAFLIDQVQEFCCLLFQAARDKLHSKRALWEKLRSIFNEYYIDDWLTGYLLMIYGRKREKIVLALPDTG